MFCTTSSSGLLLLRYAICHLAYTISRTLTGSTTFVCNPNRAQWCMAVGMSVHTRSGNIGLPTWIAPMDRHVIPRVLSATDLPQAFGRLYTSLFQHNIPMQVFRDRLDQTLALQPFPAEQPIRIPVRAITQDRHDCLAWSKLQRQISCGGHIQAA